MVFAVKQNLQRKLCIRVGGLDVPAPVIVTNNRAVPLEHQLADSAAFDAELGDAIAACDPDWVVCAGYLRILDNGFVRRFGDRLINIHPSLLPRHPGLRTHQRALDAGDAEHGASVHWVIPELDAGPVIAQVRIPVLPGDDAAALAARLLPAEHALLLSVLRKAVAGRLSPPRGA